MDELAAALDLARRGHLGEANSRLERLAKTHPNAFDVLFAYGAVLAMSGAFEASIRPLVRARALRPKDPAVHYNLGVSHARLGRRDKAIAALQTCITLAPSDANAHDQLGQQLQANGDIEAAIPRFARAVELDPANAMALSSLIELKRSVCDWSGLDALEAAIPGHVAAGRPVEPLMLVTVADDPLLQLSNAKIYAARHLGLSDGLGSFVHAPRPRDQKIRVGYLSPDFRPHPTAYLLESAFRHHDRNRFEWHALSYGPDKDTPYRREILGSFDRVHELRRLSPAAMAKAIHDARIDILVDLAGYITYARPQVLALRPAPVQVTYLGFPGTLALPGIDHILLDRASAPVDPETTLAERLTPLAVPYMPLMAPPALQPMTRPQAGFPQDAVVLCSPNRLAKVSPAMFASWMRILTASPGTVLWIAAGGGRAQARLRHAAEHAGVDPARLIVTPPVERSQHLSRLACADLALDCTPYGAHTTSSECLAVGLPLLTIKGRSIAARAASSLLAHHGLSELVTPGAEEYEARAITLASDSTARRTLKEKVWSAVAPNATDPRALPAALEAAFLDLWQSWLNTITE